MGKNIILWVAIFLAGGVADHFGTVALEKPIVIPDTPDCICPEPRIDLNSLQVDKIKGVKEFTFSPQITGSLNIAGVDSVAIKRWINSGIDAGFKRFTDKKGRLRTADLIEIPEFLSNPLDTIFRFRPELVFERTPSLAKEAAKETDDKLASEISSLTRLKDDEIKKLFPLPRTQWK